ncbi:uncharacterized protein LOC144149587 isoform X2 [Haemaphysalis longicornis]
MEVILCSQDPRGAKTRLRYFLGWKCFSTGLCYLASLVLAYFRSKHGIVIRLIKHDLDKKGETGTVPRASTLIGFALIYTVVAAFKAGIIFGMYRFYRNLDTLINPSNQTSAQPAGQGTAGYPVQQRHPVAAGGGAPASYPSHALTASETTTESNPPYPTSAPGTAHSFHPTYPVAGSGRAHESRRSTRRKSSGSLRGAKNV